MYVFARAECMEHGAQQIWCESSMMLLEYFIPRGCVLCFAPGVPTGVVCEVQNCNAKAVDRVDWWCTDQMLSFHARLFGQPTRAHILAVSVPQKRTDRQPMVGHQTKQPKLLMDIIKMK